MKEKDLLSDSEHFITRLQRLNLTDSQQQDAVTYQPGQIVEFHRMAKGAVRGGVQEKRFKSGEQWEVLRREEGIVIVGKDGVEKQLPLEQGNRHGSSVCSRERRSRWQSATGSDSRKTSNTARLCSSEQARHSLLRTRLLLLKNGFL
jgi:hypothetical protein